MTAAETSGDVPRTFGELVATCRFQEEENPDVSELLSRAASIEQILRTVE